MKRKLTLGLLVFFLGVLITSCGKKNSSSPAAAPAASPIVPIIPIGDFDCVSSASGCDVNGTYQVTNREAYGEFFGYDQNSYQPGTIYGPDYNNSGRISWDNFRGSLQATAGYCVATNLFNLFVNALSRGDDIPYGCDTEFVQGNTYGQNGGTYQQQQNNYQQVQTSYTATVQSEYDSRGYVRRAVVQIEDGQGQYGQLIEFTPASYGSAEESAQVLYSTDGRIRLTENGNGGYDMDTQEYGNIGQIYP